MPAPGNKCCIKGCHATSHNLDGSKVENGVRFFAIPKVKTWQTTDQTKEITRRRRLAWIAAIGRPDITYEKHSNGRVCSRHFHKGSPAYEMLQTDPDWAPTLHLGHDEAKTASTVQQLNDLRKPDESIPVADITNEDIPVIRVTPSMADDSRHSSSPATPSVSNPSTPRPEVRATPPLARATTPLARGTPPLNMPGAQLPPHAPHVPSSLTMKPTSQGAMGTSPGQQNQVPGHHQSKYASLLAVIEDMGRDIRPTYSGNRTSTERLKRSIVHARILVRECLMECERSART